MSYDLKRDLVRLEAEQFGYQLAEDFAVELRYWVDNEIIEQSLPIGEDWSSSWTDAGLMFIKTELPDGSVLRLEYYTGAGVISSHHSWL